MSRDQVECLYKLRDISHLYLYNQETASEILNSPMLSSLDPDKVAFKNQFRVWVKEYIVEDLESIKNEFGISREDFEILYQTADSLAQCLECPLGQDTPFFRLSILYYANQLKQIKALQQKLDDIYNGLPEEVKNASYFVRREIVSHRPPSHYFDLDNPYTLYPHFKQFLDNYFYETIRSNIESISMKTFKFAPKFKLLSTFSTDINDKGLDEEELQELQSAFSVLLLQGFLSNQVTVKLNPKELLAMKSDYQMKPYFDKETDDEIQTVSEIYYLKRILANITGKMPGFNEEKINSIYQNHSNDELTPILKPFVEELIPYYKSLITPSGYAQVTYQLSNTYQKTFIPRGMYVQKDRMPNYFLINPLYFDHLPFVLIDPPDEKFKVFAEIFKQSYCDNLFNAGYRNPPPNPKMPPIPDDLDEIEELDTLKNQKYYVVYYIANVITSQEKNYQLDLNDACFVMSLLDWKVDIDSKEGKDLDQYFKDLIKNFMRTHSYSRRTYISYFIKYIVSTVNVATEPLNPSEMKERLSRISTKVVNRETPDGTVDLNGCCHIQ